MEGEGKATESAYLYAVAGSKSTTTERKAATLPPG